ncbi:MAG: hypothetical protein M3O66_05615 [Verrucomicrobiota bacterium]|nr:hypothetical protein [Verrucomicrobiota bacterium]
MSELRLPTRTRMLIAAVIVALVVAAVWKFIDYRMQPPPPPHKVGDRVETR